MQSHIWRFTRRRESISSKGKTFISYGLSHAPVQSGSIKSGSLDEFDESELALVFELVFELEFEFDGFSSKSEFELETLEFDLLSLCSGVPPATGFLRPVDRGIVTSDYGYRISPISGRGEGHTGVDVNIGVIGKSVVAVKSGTVVSYSIYHATYGTTTGSIIMDSNKKHIRKEVTYGKQ